MTKVDKFQTKNYHKSGFKKHQNGVYLNVTKRHQGHASGPLIFYELSLQNIPEVLIRAPFKNFVHTSLVLATLDNTDIASKSFKSFLLFCTASL